MRARTGAPETGRTPERNPGREARTPRAGLLVLLFAVTAIFSAPALAEGAGGDAASRDPNNHQRIPAGLAEGLTIELVHVELLNPPREAEVRDALRSRIADAYHTRPGAIYNELISSVAVQRVRALPDVKEVEARLYSMSGGRQVAIALLVTLEAEPEAAAPKARGALATKGLRDLPLLWQDERSLVKAIFNPAVGFYVDRNPWVGNPGSFVGNPDQPRTLSVFEAGLELGIGGITRVGGLNSNTYVYGAASYLGSTTQGQDVFTSESSREFAGMEDLYAGLLVKSPGSPRSFNLSLGRQKFSLNRNLLIGHVLGANNGGERGATNLSPRNAYDMTVDARLQLGRYTLQAWFADPDELPDRDRRNQFTGINFRYNDNANVDATLTLLGVIRSDTRYAVPGGPPLRREGLRAVNPRVRWSNAFGLPGFWVEGEWAHQWHTDFDMSANGWGAWVGYTLEEHPWKPGLLYRYSTFTGDDPNTETYERFDPLTGGVQRDWAQGLVMVKITTNRNLRTHRMEFSFKPADGLDLSVDYYYFRADTLNNLGGQPPVAEYGSDELGHEITPTLQWMFNRNLFIQGLVSIVIPGEGLEEVLPEPSETWTTAQLSLYWFF